jgi:hypothetical protein
MGGEIWLLFLASRTAYRAARAQPARLDTADPHRCADWNCDTEIYDDARDEIE